MQNQEFEEQLRRREVQFLITQLMKNEEILIKLILEQLYDTGTRNWIRQKIRFRVARGGAKLIARCLKPAGRHFGYRWLVKKTPRLITGWLFRQVAFTPVNPAPVEVQPAPQTLLVDQQRQITQLQRKLKLTSGVAVISVLSVGGLLLIQNVEVLTGARPLVSPVSQNRLEQLETRLDIFEEEL